MSLRVIGAGHGRTGTNSLKLALERLLGGPCYHMFEVLAHPQHIPTWRAAVRGELQEADWHTLFDGFHAAVDFPVASFWRELIDVYPDALVLLSVRDPESWWKSAHETIFKAFSEPITMPGVPSDLQPMLNELFASRFTLDVDNKDVCIDLYNRHNNEVRRGVPSSRLVEWRPGDGWAPLCAALGMPVPNEPFPHVNTTEEMMARMAEMQENG